MADSIGVTPIALDATKRGALQSLFTSPGYLVLREVVAAQCAIRQVKSINAQMCPLNDALAELAQREKEIAQRYHVAMEVLDAIEKSEQQWVTVVLEQRH